MEKSKFSAEQIAYALREAESRAAASPTSGGSSASARRPPTCAPAADWAYRRHVQLDFIRLGTPVEDAFIESFNGRLRDDREPSNTGRSLLGDA